MSIDENIKQDFLEAVAAAGQSRTTPYDSAAEVVSIDEDGTAWVRLPGGVEETPAELTINAKPGDIVQVRVSGGRAFLMGNNSAPPTDDTTAQAATVIAEDAQEAAAHAQADIDEEKEYFWHDDGGAHVLGGKYRTDYKSDGMHIVETETGEDVAKYSADGAQIGKRTASHAVLDDQAFAMTDGNSYEYAKIEDLNTPEGWFCDQFYGDGSTTAFTTNANADRGIARVLVNGVEKTRNIDYTVSRTGGDSNKYKVTFVNAPANGAVVSLLYHTTDWMPNSAATFGQRSGMTGRLSLVVGAEAEASGWFSEAHGEGSEALSKYQIAIGRFNVSDSANKYALIVGNGIRAARANAFAFTWNGDIEFALASNEPLYSAINTLGWMSEVTA